MKRNTRDPNLVDTITNPDAFETWQQHLGRTTISNTDDAVAADMYRVPGMTIVWHTNPYRIGERSIFTRLHPTHPEYLSRLEPNFAAPHGGDPRPLADPYLSRRAIQISQHPDGAIELDRTDASTAIEANGNEIVDRVIFDPEEIETGVILVLAKRIVLVLHLIPTVEKKLPSFGLVGESPDLLRVKQEIIKIANLASPVLLTGESGTGKELVARAIHQSSERRSKPFFSINMGAIPANLAASELFGATKGAYSSADQTRPGFFLRCDTGTLFLDEIGETAPEAQVLLLRVLETGEIQRVGAQKPQKVDVRVIAATDRQLTTAVENATFRLPLYHRLASFEIALPPLRDRREDVGRLLFYFLQKELNEIGSPKLRDPGPDGNPWLSASLVGRLARGDWPGNVRQLRNVARRLVVNSQDHRVAQIDESVWRLADLSPQEDTSGVVRDKPSLPKRTPTYSSMPPRLSKTAAVAGPSTYRDPSAVNDEELLIALRETRWNLKQAAALLGISRTSLYALVENCASVRKASDLTRQEIEQTLKKCEGNLDYMVEELEVSKRGLQMRMKELGLRKPL